LEETDSEWFSSFEQVQEWAGIWLGTWFPSLPQEQYSVLPHYSEHRMPEYGVRWWRLVQLQADSEWFSSFEQVQEWAQVVEQVSPGQNSIKQVSMM